MKIRVLCIDDEPYFLELTKVYLDRDSRLDVTYVSSSDAASEALGGGEYDVIVSDYQMPGVDGVKFLKLVRARWGDIPFILFTGKGREEVAMQALNEGADFYLQKSTDTVSMYAELVSMIVQSHRRWSSEKSRDEALSRFQRYADSSKDFIYRIRVRPSVEIEYFSPAVKDMVGYEAEDFYKDPELMYKCLHPDDLERFSREIDSPKDPDKPVVFRWLHKDGRTVYTEEIWVTVKNPSGETIAIDGVSREVTDRVLAEEGLRQANRKLELIAGLIRHDTLNRLTSILAGLDLMRSDLPSETVKKTLDRMEMEAKLIARQLQFSSDYQKTIVGNPSWISLSDLATDVVASWKRPGVDYDLRLDGLEVLSDYVLERVISNLVEDSLNHGEHVTKIRMYYEAVDDGYDVVYEDNGVGIPTKEKELIFERGFGKGTGYGLYLTREVLAVSGASIKETGEYGKGVRFVIHFPRELSRTRQSQEPIHGPVNGMTVGDSTWTSGPHSM